MTNSTCITIPSFVGANGIATFSQTLVALSSVGLVCFYVYQYTQSRCGILPIYVQMVTATVYSATVFTSSNFVYVPTIVHDEVVYMPFGRWLFWISSCPAILMSFLSLFDMTSGFVQHDRVMYQVLKDIALMVLGVLAATQDDQLLKWVFFVMAWMLSIWIIYDVLGWKKESRALFPDDLNKWLTYCTAWLFSTWTIFPVLYCLGPAVFGVISGSGDTIAHSLGDLLAKNFFGFLLWWTRFKKITVFLEENGPYQSNPNYEIKERGNSKIVHASSNLKAEITPAAGFEPRVLVVEPNFAHQKLFQYLLEDTSQGGATLVQHLGDAMRLIKREPIDTYDVLLVNLQDLDSVREEIGAFRASYGIQPYFIPVIGYSLSDDMEIQHMVEMEEQQPTCTDAILKFALDPNYIADVIQVWYENRQQWKSQFMMDSEMAMNDMMHAQNRSINSLSTGTQSLGIRRPSFTNQHEVNTPRSLPNNAEPTSDLLSRRNSFSSEQIALNIGSRRPSFNGSIERQRPTSAQSPNDYSSNGMSSQCNQQPNGFIGGQQYNSNQNSSQATGARNSYSSFLARKGSSHHLG